MITPLAARLPVAVVLAVGLLSCQGATPDDAPPADQPSVSADIVQLRRDQVLQRVEVAVHNGGSAELFVQRLRLQVEGFDLPGALRKDEPILAGQVVNLPVPFSGVSCPDEGPPRIGPARVTLRARYGDDPEAAHAAAHGRRHRRPPAAHRHPRLRRPAGAA